jgi:hypothetical protein
MDPSALFVIRTRTQVLSVLMFLGSFSFYIWWVTLGRPDYSALDLQPIFTLKQYVDESEFNAFVLRRETEMPGLEGAFEEVSYYNTTAPLGQRLARYPEMPDEPECMPKQFGYSQAQADEFFKAGKKFTKCGNPDNNFLSVKDNHLVLNCQAGLIAEYVVGSLPEDETLGDVEYTTSWLPYSQPVDLGRAEFAFGRCTQSRKYAVVINRFNETAAARARNITEAIGKSLGVTPRPLTFILLIFDSVSRQHLYRNLPKTIEYLNTVGGEDFSIYDFKINNVQGENTKPNMVPLLYGYDLKFNQQMLRQFSIKEPNHNWKYLELQQEALWTHFKEMGFVTMFGFDTIWDFLSQCTGRTVLTDHMASNFWHACKQLYGYTDFIGRQRCIGAYNAHWYMLNYLQQFYENYLGINRFAYVHLSPGHEETGTVIRTADEDLRDFFATMLEAAKNKDEDIVVMLASDHGKHSNEWDKTSEGYLENQLPMHLFIANRDLVQRLNADDTLIHNSFRLVTRYDWHLTFKHLSLVPYGALSHHSAWYQALKNRSDTPNAISLLLEKVRDSRTCEDMLIPNYYCSCSDYREIPIAEALQDEVVKTTVELGIKAINKAQHTLKEFCMQVSLGELHKVEVKQLKEERLGNRYFKVRISLKESPKATFDLFSFMAIPKEFDKSPDNPNFGSQFSFFNSTEGVFDVKVQLRDVLRVDAYRGLCEETARIIETSAAQCICYKPENYSYEGHITKAQTDLLHHLEGKLTLRLGEAGQDCQEVCMSFNSACQDWGLELYNKLEMLMQPWSSNKSVKVHYRGKAYEFGHFNVNSGYRGDASFGLKEEGGKWELFLSEWSEMSCFTKTVWLKPLCPCSK